MTTYPILTLWQEVLNRELSADDVRYLEDALGVQMLGWYRTGHPTLAVRSLARSGDDSALLRVRVLAPGMTLFEATSTLGAEERFLRVHADVRTALLRLAGGLPRSAPVAALEVFGNPETERRLLDVAEASRQLMRSFNRVVQGGRGRAHAARQLRDLEEVTLQLHSAVRRDRFLLEALRVRSTADPRELDVAWFRAQRRYPGLLRDRLRPVLTGSFEDVPLVSSLELANADLLAVVERALAETWASVALPRGRKKQRRAEVRRQLEAAVAGYTMLARAVGAEDVDLVLVGAALLSQVTVSSPGRRGRREPPNPGAGRPGD